MSEGTVWEIRGGRVRAGTVRSRLPGSELGSRFLPGRMPQPDATLTAVRDTLARCAPWLTCYLGPRLWSVSSGAEDHACRASVRVLAGGKLAYEHRGLAAWDEGWVMVSGSGTVPEVLATLHHEVWHACELGQPGLDGEDVAILDQAAARGLSRPGSYLDSAIERRARLYESWAGAADEGWRPAMLAGSPLRRLDRVCWYVWSGGMAADVARHGRTRPQGGRLGRAGRRAGRVAGALLGWPLPCLWLAAGAVAWAAR